MHKHIGNTVVQITTRIRGGLSAGRALGQEDVVLVTTRIRGGLS